MTHLKNIVECVVLLGWVCNNVTLRTKPKVDNASDVSSKDGRSGSERGTQASQEYHIVGRASHSDMAKPMPRDVVKSGRDPTAWLTAIESAMKRLV
jgi:hypothetical protein